MTLYNRRLIATEAQEMIAFMEWTKLIMVPTRTYPIKAPLRKATFHIPNESKRTKGGHILQARMGRRKGASDILICIASGEWNNLFIEMKSCDHRAKPSLAQKLFIRDMKEFGSWGVIAYGANDAIDHTLAYLKPILKDDYAHTLDSKAQSQEINF